MWDFWKGAAAKPIPAWLGMVVALAAALLVIAGIKRRKRRGDKVDLRIVILPTPPPRWGIGAMGNEPYLSLMVHARLAHRAHESLEIVNVHLQGTTCTAPFFPIVVAGPYDPSVMIHFGVRPILAKESKTLRRRIILIDQFGDEHKSKAVTFLPPGKYAAGRFGADDAPIKCHVCHEPVARENLFEGAHIPAHRACIK
jgi:hypothetical protein